MLEVMVCCLQQSARVSEAERRRMSGPVLICMVVVVMIYTALVGGRSHTAVAGIVALQAGTHMVVVEAVRIVEAGTAVVHWTYMLLKDP